MHLFLDILAVFVILILACLSFAFYCFLGAAEQRDKQQTQRIDRLMEALARKEGTMLDLTPKPEMSAKQFLSSQIKPKHSEPYFKSKVTSLPTE